MIWKNKYDLTLCQTHLHTASKTFIRHKKKLDQVWFEKINMTSRCVKHIYTLPQKLSSVIKKNWTRFDTQMNPQNIVLCPQTNSAFLKEAEGFLFQSFWYISVLRAARDGLEIVVSVEKRVRKGKRGSSFCHIFNLSSQLLYRESVCMMGCENLLKTFCLCMSILLIKNILFCVQRWMKVLQVWNHMRVSN